MKANYKIAVALVAGITIGGTTIASAQSLKSKIVGGWTLVEGSEIMADGKKVVPWAKGSLIIDRDGQISFFVLGKDRSKTDSVRTPAAPMVAWYGSYTVDETGKKYSAKIEGASSPAFEGAVREQTVTFKDNTMTTTGSKVQTPEGLITPVNVWKKAK